MGPRALWWVVALVMVVGIIVNEGEAAVDCGKVTGNIAGCLSYVKFKGSPPVPSSVCCKGVKAIDAMATTRPLRQQICQCLQNAAVSLKPDTAAVGKLASLCGATHAFSLNQKCSQVP